MSADGPGALTTFVSEDRARVYRVLARLLREAEPAARPTLHRNELPELRMALGRLGAGPGVQEAAGQLARRPLGRTIRPGRRRRAALEALAVELETMQLLALREAAAHAEEGRALREAGRRFVGEHLAPDGHRLARRLARSHDPFEAALGRVLAGFLDQESTWLGVEARSAAAGAAPNRTPDPSS